jgi:uncharacterized LabA/DUF88 family protein
MPDTPPDRAHLFIDGNNWFHSLKDIVVAAPFALSYAKISQKLVGPRDWVSTGYYIGALKQDWNARDYAAQRSFLAQIQKDDPRISVHLGRLERRVTVNPLRVPLLTYIEDASKGLPPSAVLDLRALINAHAQLETLKEKAVDIMIARDILEGAIEGTYDAAYLLSADGDFTPVIESARKRGRKVYVASPSHSYNLRQTANAFIKLDAAWFSDCYR